MVLFTPTGTPVRWVCPSTVCTPESGPGKSVYPYVCASETEGSSKRVLMGGGSEEGDGKVSNRVESPTRARVPSRDRRSELST